MQGHWWLDFVHADIDNKQRECVGKESTALASTSSIFRGAL